MTVACRRVLDVVSGQARVARGSWPVARVVPTAKRGPWPPSGDRAKESEIKAARLEGLTRPRRARECERKARGWAGRTAFSLVLLPCLLVEAPPKGSYSFFLLVPPPSLFLSPLFSRSPALVRAHARTLVREGSRGESLSLPELDSVTSLSDAAYHGCN